MFDYNIIKFHTIGLSAYQLKVKRLNPTIKLLDFPSDIWVILLETQAII